MKHRLIIQELELYISGIKRNIEHYNKMIIIHKDSNPLEAELHRIMIWREEVNLSIYNDVIEQLKSLISTSVTRDEIEELRLNFK